MDNGDVSENSAAVADILRRAMDALKGYRAVFCNAAGVCSADLPSMIEGRDEDPPSTHSAMQAGSVDELFDIAVERPALE